ncbi:MAG: hypothetical protein CVU84_02635 [Firmicutes bacterium HGW-Firmicutes-1]|jgi:flagellar basal body-associated protein FliL|nr:MAG: hypothetical protein CVU84_02635 [Firmicutes bacterium HGW-Firmicutes-1]
MDKGKIIFIVGAIFIVIALVLSSVSVIMMSSVVKKLNGGTEEEVVAEEGEKVIPLSETTNFELKSPVIAILKSEISDKSMNKSIEIGFRLDNENKKTEGVLELMGANEGIIRDRISKLIETKSVEDFEKPGFTQNLQKEILDLISTAFETDTIVEVYFKNNLGSSK